MQRGLEAQQVANQSRVDLYEVAELVKVQERLLYCLEVVLDVGELLLNDFKDLQRHLVALADLFRREEHADR